MKKLFITSLLTGVISLSLFSCNNGPYDINPAEDNTAALNPLDSTSGVTVYLGTMQARINGLEVFFDRVFYNIDTFNTRKLVAYIYKDPVFHRKIEIIYPENTYNGVDTYKIGAYPGVSFIYTRYDTTEKKFVTYNANTGQPSNLVTFNVAGEEGGHMRGHMNGSLFRTTPKVLTSDTVNISGEYYAQKRPFPNPF